MGDGIITSATERLANAGLLGTFVLVFGFVIFWLWRDAKNERKAYQNQLTTLRKECDEEKKALLEKHSKERQEILDKAEEERDGLQKKIDESQTARIGDAKAFQADTLNMARQVTLAITNANTLMDSQRDATLEVRGALREQTEELRTLGNDIRDRLARRDHG